MKKAKPISRKMCAAVLALSMAAAPLGSIPVAVFADEEPAFSQQVTNGDFESGDMSGWMLLDGTPATSDNNDVGVISSGSTFWGSRNFYKQGTYFLSGAEREGSAGAVRSSTFTLGGDGYIAFLIGAASSEGRGCVKVYEADGGKLVRTYTNANWNDPVTGNTLLRIYDRLEEYIGKNLYFVVENGSEPGFSFINADDFRTSMTEADVAALYAEDAARVRGVDDEYSVAIRALYKDVVYYGSETFVGEGLEPRKAVVQSSLKDSDTISPGTTLNLASLIRNSTSIQDGFGLSIGYDIVFDSISHGGTELKDQAEALKLDEGVYEVAYRVLFELDGEALESARTYTIKAEKPEVGENVVNGDFETGDLTGWTMLDGTPAVGNPVGIVTDEASYWGNRNVYIHGKYCLRGDSKEGDAGSIRSSSFILGGDGYISFMIGAAAKEGSGCVRLYQENGDSDLLVKTYTNKQWNDPKTGLTLIRVFDRLDSSYLGKELYFVIENGAEAGFSFINADDFRASMTEAEVKALQEEQLDWLAGFSDPYSEYITSCYRQNGLFNDIVLAEEIDGTIFRYSGLTVDLEELIASETKVVESYSLNEVPVDITVKSVSFNGRNHEGDFGALYLENGVYEVAYTRSYGGTVEDKLLKIETKQLDPAITEIQNPGFETGDLTGWEVITPDVWNKDENGNYKGVVSAQTYWGEQLPYNQEGNYHLNGWEVTGDEGASWSLRSSVFTLAGSGFISLRMGSNAASVRVYKLDGTLIGTYYQSRFNDASFPFINEGGSWADMGTYFIDLTDHIGEAMYIELHDSKISGGWANAFFDDIKTHYSYLPVPEDGHDTVTGPISRNEAGELLYGEISIPWTLAKANTEPVILSFEDEGYDVVNAGGSKETSPLESIFKKPVYQDEPVLPARPNGVSGKALALDGYSNTAAFNESVSGSELTVDAYIAPRAFMWDNPNSDREDQIAEVIVGSYDTGRKAGFLLGITKHGYLAFRAGTGDNWYSMTSDDGKQVSLYEWNRVTGVFDGDAGVMRVYLNGEPAGSKSIDKFSEIVGSGKPVLLGKGSEPVIVTDNYFDGTMFPGLVDEVSVRTAALTSKQVKDSGLTLPVLPYEDARVADSVLENDWYRPVYHAAPPANWMNEPHALFNYNNRWHLFYQTNQGGPFWRNISWGHWVSDDMVSWRCVKDAVVPTDGTVAPDGIWTGNVIFTSDGYPLLLITAGDDSRAVNGSNQHVGLVRAADYSDPDLTDWDILGYCVAQTPEMGTVGEFRDAQCISIGDERYMVVGGAENGQGIAHIFKTTAATLAEWEAGVADKALNGMGWTYMGSLFGDFYKDHEYKQAYGTVWEMPNIAPLLDKDGKQTGKYLFVFSPQYGDNDVWYYIGSFDPAACRFIPDFADAQLMDYGNNIFTGPTLYVNPSDGRTYICSIMQENPAGEYSWTVENRINSGWAFYAGLPRELYLKDDGTLGIRCIDTAPIEGDTIVSFTGLTAAAANEQLKQVDSDTVKIEFTFEGGASEVGFKLKNSENGCSRFFINDTAMGLDGQSGPYTKGSTVSGVIYVDKCSVEAYVDESKTVSGSKFFKGTGLELFAGADTRCSVTVTSMKSIRGLADEPAQESDIEKYVKRLYAAFLSREPDAAGLESWVTMLNDGSTDLMHVIRGFVLSPEFEQEGLDDEGYIAALYNVVFDREPDKAGLDAWLNVLENGATRKLVLAGFVNSAEMKLLAESLGVAAGTYKSNDILDANYRVTSFVARLYRVCLSRKYDVAGLKAWVSAILDGASPALIVKNFLTSREMAGLNLDDEAFLAVCYKAIFDREPDTGGMANWLSALAGGKSRSEVVSGFTASKEFALLCESLGIA